MVKDPVDSQTPRGTKKQVMKDEGGEMTLHILHSPRSTAAAKMKEVQKTLALIALVVAYAGALMQLRTVLTISIALFV
ncbi:MAG: hypothetical protein AAFU83_02335 [Bacteroidota bacterium]